MKKHSEPVDDPKKNMSSFGIVLIGVAIFVGIIFAGWLRGMSVKTDRAVAAGEKAVAVAERMDSRVEDAFEAVAPVGSAAVVRATEALESIDGEELGEAAQEGVKEIGAAAKDAAKAFFSKAEE